MSTSDVTKGQAGKKADDAASAVDKVSEGALTDTSKIFKIPSGVLNSWDPPIAVVDRISTSAGGWSALKAAVRKQNSYDATTGMSNPTGIVLRIENPVPAEDAATGGFISSAMNMLGLTPDKPLRKVKVLVPGLHKMLVRPDGPGAPFGEPKNKNDKIIDMFPTFEAISNAPEFDTLAVGDLVKVDFPTKNNFTTSGRPMLTEVIKKSLPPAGLAAFCTDSNVYQSNPPAGDPLPAGQRATGHTGEGGSAQRARNRRAISQLFVHKSSSEHLFNNMSALITSKGYSVGAADSPGDKIIKKTINKNDAAYQHTATLSELIAAESAFIPSAEMITIVFKKAHSDAELSPAEEKYKLRSIFSSVVDTIDKKVGTKSIINFILDVNPATQSKSQLHDAMFNFLLSDPDFNSASDVSRLGFYSTSNYYQGDALAAPKLNPDESALFVQSLKKLFVVAGSDPSPVENKKPGPAPVDSKKPSEPSGYDVNQLLLSIMEANVFPDETGMAKKFLEAIVAKLKLSGLSDLEALEPSYNALTNELVTDIIGQALPPEELVLKRNQLIEKIQAARSKKIKEETKQKTPVPAQALPTMTQPNSSCAVMSGGNTTVGSTSYPSVSNSFLEGSESGSDMAIPNISPAPAKNFRLAKKARHKKHNSIGDGITLPAGLETGGKIPMKFDNASDFPVYHGLQYTRKQVIAAAAMPPKSTDYTIKSMKYLKISGGRIDPKLMTDVKNYKGPNAKPTTRIVSRALPAFNAAWEEIHNCPEGKNFMYGTQDANQSYQFIVKSSGGNISGLTKRYFGHRTATAAVMKVQSQGHKALGKHNGKKLSHLGLSHVSGVGFDLRATRNQMTSKRLPPSRRGQYGLLNEKYAADPNWWKSQYKVDVNQIVNQTPEGSNKTYELMPMDHPACITKILKKYGFRFGGDYGSHRAGARADAMHYEFFGDPRILDKIKAKSYAAGPKPPDAGVIGGGTVGPAAGGGTGFYNDFLNKL